MINNKREKISHWYGLFIIILLVQVLSGCGGGGNGLPTANSLQIPTLSSISVTPGNPTISNTTSQQFSTTGTYSDGSKRNITGSVTWTSGTTSVATINGSGFATGVSVGSSVVTASVGGLSSSTTLTVTPYVAPTNNVWTWMSGSNLVYQNGVYGTQGVASAGNIPGARIYAVSWIDGSGNRWLFGGIGNDSAGTTGSLNDLWKFDGTNWTWVSGSTIANQNGIYGTKGTAAAGNVPGGRSSSVSWMDGSGHLWLFGGSGYDSAGANNYLNDLWKFDGTNWTWVSGSNIVSQQGVYGTQGTAAGGNIPGARYGANSWMDGSGHLWLFGGEGIDSTGTFSFLNDLWKFDGTNWTWVNGSNVVNQNGVYGTMGMAAGGNVPGARFCSLIWVDASGHVWLFGGYGKDSSGTSGELNDLWKFDGTNWTWVNGSNVVNQNAVYGTKGTAASGNIPGARYNSISWIDGSGNRWLFGGWGFDSGGNFGGLNDLWKFDGTNWTWMSGSTIRDQKGVYGTQGIAATANIPGGREGAISWIDGNGYLWLFGGLGTDSAGNPGYLNDLWRYQP